ncbi:MAG: hypothetical protein ISR69_10870 [Gammaproteobacteria bacterium]|nr:hypothetical protein [Gammaproteobacteria bacterium]
MFKSISIFLFILVSLLPFSLLAESSTINNNSDVEFVWGSHDAHDDVEVSLYFFWSETCPHCTAARPIIDKMADDIPWLKLHSYSTSNKENRLLYHKMATSLGQDANSVPGFLFCGVMLTGFDETISPPQLEKLLTDCYQQFKQQVSKPVIDVGTSLNIPLIGEIDAQSLSLPILTLVIASLDSFNPCAFFVLLFLLSLLIHARNRKRMIIISGLFITVSGIVYFLFMTAWLNLFMLIGDSRWITLIAGLVAITIASINIKDYFWFKQGLSLSMSDSAKHGLFQRMRGLLNANNMSTMIISTIVLALVANSYELLCTAGFPMVYTRALTLHELPNSSYYLYLIFYNLIYVIPLLVIASIFILTLGSRKLQENEGKSLKLLSGIMMLLLGVILVSMPELLNNIAVAVGILLASVLMTILFNRLRTSR